MIYQGLSTTFVVRIELIRMVVQISSVTSPAVLGLMSLVLLVVGVALIGVVVVAQHGCLPPREHRVVWNCAVTGTCRFCSAFWCTPVKDVAFLLEETSAFALYFIIERLPSIRVIF